MAYVRVGSENDAPIEVYSKSDSDAIVPFEVSGRRSHEAIASSSLVVVEGAPHGFNATHAEEFNGAVLDFLS